MPQPQDAYEHGDDDEDDHEDRYGLDDRDYRNDDEAEADLERVVEEEAEAIVNADPGSYSGAFRRFDALPHPESRGNMRLFTANADAGVTPAGYDALNWDAHDALPNPMAGGPTNLLVPVVNHLVPGDPDPEAPLDTPRLVFDLPQPQHPTMNASRFVVPGDRLTIRVPPML